MLNHTTFIFNGDGLVEAVYVNNKLQAGDRIDNHPKYSSTWLGLIEDIRIFSEITKKHLSSKAIQKYLNDEEADLPLYLTQFKEGELCDE